MATAIYLVHSEDHFSDSEEKREQVPVHNLFLLPFRILSLYLHVILKATENLGYPLST
jgi:hypothetical protein